MADLLEVRLSATDNFSTVMTKMLRSLDSIAGAHIGYTAAVIGTTAAVAASISVAAEYEQQLAKVNTMLSLGEEKFLPGYAAEMMNLAAATGQGTQALTDAAFDILSASRGAAGAMALLAETNRAAAAGFTDVNVATSGALTTLNAFKLANSDITDVLDRQFAAVKRGRFTYEQYANNIGQLAATASLAGQSLEAMNSAVSTVTRGGISAERAITSINRAILTFIKPAKEAAAAADKYGIELGANAVSGDNLANTLKDLKKLSAEQLAEIFRDIRGFKAISVLTQDYAGFVRDLGEQHNSAGEMARAHAKATDTLTFEAGRSVEIFRNLGRTIGGIFTPSLKAALKAVNNLVTGVVELNVAPDLWLERQKAIMDILQKTRGLTAEEVILLGKINGLIAARAENEDDIAKFLQRAEGFAKAKTQHEIDAEKSVEKQLEHQEELVKVMEKVEDIRKQSFARRASEALSTSSQRSGGGGLKGLPEEFDAEKLNKLQEIIEKEEKYTKQVRAGVVAANERNNANEKLKEHVTTLDALAKKGREMRAAMGADGGGGLFGGALEIGPGSDEEAEREESLRRQVEAAQDLGDAKIRAKERERIAHEEMMDGILTKDQDYWASVSELMRSTYDAQATMATLAATQTVAFVDRAFSALETELMKSKASSKEVIKALELEAKRGAIRTILELAKNELKSIFVVEKAKKTSEASTAIEAAALRKAAYADQVAKVLGNVYGNTFASIAAIPILGPALAPAAAITAQTSVAGVMAVGAAHGGIDEIPGYLNNQTFILKSGERVVQPSANVKLTSFLDRVESGEFGGGGGGASGGQTLSNTITINLDGEPFKVLVMDTVTEGTRDGDIVIDSRSVA